MDLLSRFRPARRAGWFRQARRGGTQRPYRGPDRRGLIRRFDRPVGLRTAVGMTLAVVGVPVVVAACLTAGGGSPLAWSTGIADVAFVTFAAAALLLVLRWRLVGDAACISLAGVAALSGLVLVPVVSHATTAAALGGLPVTGRGLGLSAGLRAAAVVLVAVLSVRALRGPEVHAGLRPARTVAAAVVVTLALGVPLGLSPSRTLVQAHLGGVGLVDVIEAAGALVLAGLLLVEAIRRRRLLLIGGATLLIAVAAACGAAGLRLSGSWRNLAVLFLAVGAVELVVAVGSDLQSAINAVVLHDVRGRRRWEAAESKLTEVRSSIQGQRHDVRNMLSAIDGTLLLLYTQRDQLPAGDVDRLLAAVRDELHWLQALVGGGDRDARSYDLGELLAAVVSVRLAGAQQVHCRLQPDIALRGRPDRLAIAVDNLLVNAAVHAPHAAVTLATGLLDSPLGPLAEIVVSDDGPGMSDAQLPRAVERGWRGTAAPWRPGSGLGLAQCRDLVEAEGGSFTLGPTDPDAPDGHRGLTVRLRLPVRPLAGAPPTPPAGEPGAGAETCSS